MRFREAVAFAYAMDWPLNIGITITWAALETAGERNEGHCLGRGEWDREKYTRDELARLCRSEGLPFVALWGRDVGADMGSHVHLSIFWPSYKLAQLVAVIERISGSSADFVLKPYTADVVARDVAEAVTSDRGFLFTGPMAKLGSTAMRLSRRWARRLTISASKQNGYLAE